MIKIYFCLLSFLLLGFSLNSMKIEYFQQCSNKSETLSQCILNAKSMDNQNAMTTQCLDTGEILSAVCQGSTNIIRSSQALLDRNYQFNCICTSAAIRCGNTATLYALVKGKNFYEDDLKKFLLEAIKNKDEECYEILEEHYCTSTSMEEKFPEVFEARNKWVKQSNKKTTVTESESEKIPDHFATVTMISKKPYGKVSVSPHNKIFVQGGFSFFYNKRNHSKKLSDQKMR